MTSKLQEYLQNWRTYYGEGLTIEMLERELKKRKVRRAKALTSVEKISDWRGPALTEIKAQLKGERRRIADAVADEITARWQLGDKSWMAESLEPVDAFFDFGYGEKPNIIVRCPGDEQSSVTINIIKSLRRDPKNIGNPLIIAAIERYVDCLVRPRVSGRSKGAAEPENAEEELAIPFGPTGAQAEKYLERVFRALKAGWRSQQQRSGFPNQVEAYLDWLTSDFDDDYFDRVSRILKEKEIRGCEKLKTIWKSRIRRRLRNLMPDFDHKPFLDFLTAAPLPRTKTPAALRNAFFARRSGVGARSFAKYKSQGLKLLREHTKSFRSVADIDEATDMAFAGLLLRVGIGKVEIYDDFRSSNLVWEVKPTANSTPGGVMSRVI